MSPDVVAVALGWLRGEVRLSDVKRVLKVNTSAGAYQRVALALREAWQEGLLRYEPPSMETTPEARRAYRVSAYHGAGATWRNEDTEEDK
jgi:hypothetical protein